MSVFLIGAIYITTWFITMFALLPIGLVREESPGEGHAAGAPKSVGLRWKLIVNTLLSGVITCGIVWLMVIQKQG